MEQQTLAQGTVIGDRFEVVELAGTGDLGRVYKALDKKTDKPVALRVIPEDRLPDEAEIDRLRLRVKEASTLTHRNVRATFGMGLEDGVGLYVAAEWIDGQSLRSLLTKRTEQDKRFTFKGAYNIMGHLCNGLTHAHEKTAHGSLSPRAILVTRAGRVKIGDWALSLLRPRLEDYPGRQKVEGVFWSPEIMQRPDAPAPADDIYSLGAIFYELITGVPPKRPLKAPSKLGFDKEVDAIIAKCIAPRPEQRFASPAEVKAACAQLVKKEANRPSMAPPGVPDDDFGIDVEVELGGLESAPPGPAHGAGVKAGSMTNAPDLPPPRNTPDSGGTAGPIDDRVSTIDMGAVLGSIGQTESAHWMVQKDKFDHGPFTDRELVQMILLGEVLGNHQLLNMDDGVRKKVRAWEMFDEYLERYRIKKKEREEQLALERTEKAETRGNAAKWAIALGVVGVIALAAGGYFLSRQLRKEKTYSPEEMVAALDSGEIKLKTGGNLIKRERGKRRRRGGGGSGGGGGGGGGGGFADGLSYEEAMNVAMSMGSLTNNAGQKQLTPGDIMNIMDRNVRRFLPCMAGQSIKRVDMDIAIAGDGRVMGISVKQGDAKLKKCVTGKVRRIKFPASGAPRTAASWYFELY